MARDSVIFILDPEASRPIFHKASAYWFGDLTTVCSRRIDNDIFHTVRIPRRHAIKFARPCKRCWPTKVPPTH